MVLDIKMCRFDNVPWGFRLVGGSDFELPLTVVKVTEGSIAEEAGLRVNDVIVRINDTAASPLTHDEAHNIIMHCGNVFYFGVQRECEEEENVPSRFPIIGTVRPSTPESFLEVSSTKTYSDDLPLADEYLDDLCDRPNSVLSEHTERKLVEEEIAAVLSGESEVLKEHNVMGIFPKPGVCMSSDVLRTLNEEAVKTKAEKDKENKKWTTFLQKPDRPIPRSKAQIEAERHAANAYKVKIVKSAPRSRSVSPAVQRTPEPEPMPAVQPPKEPTPPAVPVVEEPPPTDSEVPNLEETPAAATATIEQPTAEDDGNDEPSQEDEKADKEKEATPDEQQDNEAAAEATINTTELDSEQPMNAPEPATAPVPQKTAEELALERQLADVQKQLQALSSLPSTIQATLDAVTKQLGELLPTFKLQQVQPTKEEPREINLERIEETKQDDTKAVSIEGSEHDNGQQNRDVAQKEEEEEEEEIDSNKARDIDDYYEAASLDPTKQHDAMERQQETRQMEQEQNLKKQKPRDVIEELEVQLERKNNPKRRSKRAFGPLTPSSERPLVLPGGRRWYKPKDAYNDEFIAETLSAQAELITGTTLGVNFMKYQKPERKIDLDRSEVYKIIHHLDRKPVRGIEVRAPVVPAAVDIRKAVQS